MTLRISQQQLESYLWGAAVLLRGTVDAGDYKQFIFPLLFYKRLCDVFDEETQIALKESGGDIDFAAYPENHRFQIPLEAHWREVRKAAKSVGVALQSAMRAIETANPDKLYGIFGDAQWPNKDRLSDAMLRDLVEHFSTLKLSIANLPEDELGQGYEYLIKKFADDSGHTAAEFYTNRTVVHLMTEMLEPRPGESIYDPTCGSGGMLLSSIAHLRRQKQEWRNVHLYGQERNLMTSSIARMNCFLHGIEDFQIVRGDTLSEPKLVKGDRLMQFDVVLANPPYSIKQWDRDAFASDAWGRNLYGTPPQGRADYAFWQHILCSLKPKAGRCAILFPHGVLFRREEADMRRKLIDADVIECVLGLGPNLFYNSPMEACVVICRAATPKQRQGRILFINAVNEVIRERAQSFLTDDHIERVVAAYRAFKTELGFTRVATVEEVHKQGGNLSIPLYVEPVGAEQNLEPVNTSSLEGTVKVWLKSRRGVPKALAQVLPKVAISEEEVEQGRGGTCELLAGKARWTRVRFGDVVDNLNETERNPTESGLCRFIGLEHLEPGSLHVQTWGDVADGTTFTRRCRPGQVLFGKRRAYQRKVAIAEFDAVVSGDIYVLVSKNKQLLPGLLPFLCRSERFYQHAVVTSAGSLSPRTNWSSLASFEFALPPLDQQRRTADILWAMDSSFEGWRRCANQHLESLHAYASALTLKGVERRKTRPSPIGEIPDSWECLRLEEVITSSAYGPRFPGSQYSPNGNVQTVRTTDFDREGGITFGEIPTANVDGDVAEAHKLRTGDFLLSRSGEYAGLTAVFSEPDDGHVYIPAAFLIRYRFDERLDADYLLTLCCSEFGNKFVTPLATGSAQPNISGTAFSHLFIPVPSISEQREIVQAVSRIRQGGRRISSHTYTTQELASCLMNSLTAWR